jgi:hypothetical protein
VRQWESDQISEEAFAHQRHSVVRTDFGHQCFEIHGRECRLQAKGRSRKSSSVARDLMANFVF